MPPANSKKRRPTKHRGNAAGKIEARGRTSPGAKGTPPAKGGRGPRANRFDQPPSWRGASIRAGIAALLFVALVILAFGQPVGSTLTMGVFVFLLYIPLGYYTDLMFHKRRVKVKERR